MTHYIHHNFESKAKEIFRLICQYSKSHSILSIDGKTPLDSFVRSCYIGFAEAQKLIIDEIINIQTSKKELKHEIKEIRKGSSSREEIKVLQVEIQEKIDIKSFGECVLRKLADSIAWHLIDGQNHLARRLCLQEASRPDLSSSELLSVVGEVTSYNNSDPLSFALLSDITSFIQIGDILRRDGNGLNIIEVKTGRKNREANVILERISKDRDVQEKINQVSDEKIREQIRRMHRQNVRKDRVSDIIGEGAGIDPSSGRQVITTEVSYENYFQDLRILLDEFKEEKKDWRYKCIDNCLHIGVYKNEWKRIGETALRISASTNENYPIFNLAQGINQAFVEPIFVKPLTEEQIFDIVFGRISVLFLLRVDKFVEIIKDFGGDVQFLSKKRTRKEQGKHEDLRLLTYDGQCIEVKGKKIVGDGILYRIIYDNVTPISAAKATAIT